MYNGIGLPTARGSGTNGYVQRNLSFIRKHKEKVNYKTEEEIKKLDAVTYRPPNPEILDHERKRKIEVRCVELEEVMEEQGFSQEEIERKIIAFREMLIEKEDERTTIVRDEFGRPIIKESHQAAEAQQEKNNRLREALGIPASFVDGSSFDISRKTKEASAVSRCPEEAEVDKNTRKRKKSRERTKSSRSSTSSHEKKKKKDKPDSSVAKDKKKKKKHHHKNSKKQRKSVKDAGQKAKKKTKKRKRSYSSSDNSTSSSNSDSSLSVECYKSRKKSCQSTSALGSSVPVLPKPSQENACCSSIHDVVAKTDDDKAAAGQEFLSEAAKTSRKEKAVEDEKEAEVILSISSRSSASSLSYSPVDRHPELYHDTLCLNNYASEHCQDTPILINSSPELPRQYNFRRSPRYGCYSRSASKSLSSRVSSRSCKSRSVSSCSGSSSSRSRSRSRSSVSGFSCYSHSSVLSGRSSYRSSHSCNSVRWTSRVRKKKASGSPSHKMHPYKRSRDRTNSRSGSWRRSLSRSLSSCCRSRSRSLSKDRMRNDSSTGTRSWSASSARTRSSRPSSSCSSCGRSDSLPRRPGSPSWKEKRRITSARKRPIPYHRPTPSPCSSGSSWIRSPSSCCRFRGLQNLKFPNGVSSPSEQF